MGRSRGCLTTNIHALVEADGRPIRLELAAGQATDAPMAEKLPSDVKLGATLLADKVYDNDAIRTFVRNGNVGRTSPQRPIENRTLPSADGYTASATSLSVSSTASKRCAARPRDMTGE